jgi:hypothetical protein
MAPVHRRAQRAPSSPQQTRATARALPAVTPKCGRNLRARSTNTRTASDPSNKALESDPDPASGNDIGGTRQSVSPASLNGARLVASTVTSGHAPRIVDAASADVVPASRWRCAARRPAWHANRPQRRAIIGTLVLAGLRIGELCGLPLDRLDLVGGRIHP